VAGDTALEAAELMSSENRFVLQAWDSQRSIAEELAKTLHLNVPAWDVYLVYEPGTTWTGETAPAPSFWMHQLGKRSGADPALHLVPAKLQNELTKALAAKASPLIW